MAEMTPVDWAKRPLQKYADFTGRAPRAEYWWYVLATVVAYLVVMFVERLVGLANMIGPYGLLSFILMLGLLVPGLAVGIRRLCRGGRNGGSFTAGLVRALSPTTSCCNATLCDNRSDRRRPT